MQNFSNPKPPDTEYIPRDDESEAKYYRDLVGVGEVNTLEDWEVKQYSINDFGLGLDVP